MANVTAGLSDDDTAMNHAPSLQCIQERLSRAVRQFAALPGSERLIGVPLSSGPLERAVTHLLERRNEWLAGVPALREVQSWVEVHWDTERQTRPPTGTVTTGDELGNQGEVQLDAPTATCKLLLAAAGHGAETVAKYAMGFAAHGMIEVRNIYLLKGIQVSEAQWLDDYCTLVPYREALEKANAAPHMPDMPDTVEYLRWPPETADDLCALEVRSFEHRGIAADEFERRVSRLLQCGPETLALILGLVWGKGFRLFGRWHDIPAPVTATLPFLRANSSGGGSGSHVMIALQGWKPPNVTTRPLAIGEVAELMDNYAVLPVQSRKSMELALRRLRDSTERIGIEDKVIDVCIALEALFMEGKPWDQKKTVSRRASWHFADSHREREQTREAIKEFYDFRSDIVHGNTPEDLKQEEQDLRVAQLADVENVVRASLKSMISEGRPQDWEDCKDPKSIRHDPPRAETEIPSVKSDSLSWSLKEQKEIDRALEAVWKPTVDDAPSPSPDASVVCYQGVNREQIEQYKQQGIYYIIRIPALLYMAHPKWIERAAEPLDDHTRYYCGKDVELHFERWGKAAHEKKVHQFELPLESAVSYLPRNFDFWRKAVSEEPEREELP